MGEETNRPVVVVLEISRKSFSYSSGIHSCTRQSLNECTSILIFLLPFLIISSRMLYSAHFYLPILTLIPILPWLFLNRYLLFCLASLFSGLTVLYKIILFLLITLFCLQLYHPFSFLFKFCSSQLCLLFYLFSGTLFLSWLIILLIIV